MNCPIIKIKGIIIIQAIHHKTKNNRLCNMNSLECIIYYFIHYDEDGVNKYECNVFFFKKV